MNSCSLLCSKNCNHEKHIETGFSTFFFENFDDIVSEKINLDKVLDYINSQSIIF